MKLKLILAGIVFAAGITLGVGLDRWLTEPKVTTIVRDNTITQVVEKPVVEYRDAIRYVQDRAEVEKLLAQAKAQDDKITTLTETLARAQSGGAGTVTYVDRTITTPGEVHFADWRLRFDAIGPEATYKLDQRFEALTIVGKDPRGAPIATVRMFEVGPGETRTPLSDAETLVVAAQPNPIRWHLRGSVQAGMGLMADKTYGGIGALQWFKRGSSPAAEDTSLALFSPAVFVSSSSWSVGALPVSVNLGRLPKQPFRDLWLSPYVGAKSNGGLMYGFALTATF